MQCAFAFRAPDREREPVPDSDQRKPLPLADGRQAAHERAEASLRARLPKLKVHRHPLLGSPAWVMAGDEWLTGTNGVGGAVSRATRDRFASDDPHAPAKAFIHEHASLFGHDASALDPARARVLREYRTAHNGVHTVVWQQEHAGISVFEARIIAHSTPKGELISIASQFLADLPSSEKAGMPNRPALDALPIGAARAVVLALESLGGAVKAEAVVAQGAASGPEQSQQFVAPGAIGLVDVRLVWLPLHAEAMRLAWEVELTSQARGEMFQMVIDVETGAVWVRHCLTHYLSNASFRVITGGESPTPRLPGYPNPGSNAQPATVARTVVTFSALDTVASPDGWIHDGNNSTLGNNVDAHLDLDDNDIADVPRPQGSPSRVFDFPLNLSFSPSSYRNAAVVNLFYWCNWMHDKLYELGFTEGAGNFQADNFGKGGIGNDAVQADAQDGGGFNNANFGVGADGKTPRMQMYVYDGPSPDRDGDLDLTVVLHEYTHGLSTRLVGGGVGITAHQTGAMGEGWSDFYSLALLAPAGASLSGNYPHSAYAIQGFTKWGSFANPGDNYYFGSRRYPYCTNMQVNPLTFRDIDPNQIASHPSIPKSPLFPGVSAGEVHNAGEVWCMTLWEARAKLIGKLGHNAGNQLILQIVTDGMRLSPPNPTFVQARDAILQADQMDSGGAHKADLWEAFAKRGLGEDALASSANTTVGVVESFSVPDTLKVIPLNYVSVFGPAGGPFGFVFTNYVVSNITASALAWSASTVSPLSLSPSAGTLAAHGAATVKVSFNAAQVPIAITNFDTFVAFSNHVSHVTHTRRVALRTTEPLSLETPLSFPPGDVFYGPQGGPFESFIPQPYHLKNASALPMNWAVVPTPYLKVAPSSGTLAANGAVDLIPTPTLQTQSLPIGDYTNALTLSNLTTHTAQDASIEFHVRNDSYLTELLNDGALDIQNTTVSFIPDGSARGYQVCRQPANSFPTDPAGGTELHHDQYSYDSAAEVVLSGGKHVSLYGQTATHVWVNFSGSITLGGAGSASAYDALNEHFAHRQVSGLFDDYYDGYAIKAGATISWRQLPDRFVATWQKLVNGYYGDHANNFQIELFFSGAIRITILDGYGDFSVVGLSRGTGTPKDFISTDFAALPTCSSILPDLHLSMPVSFKESPLVRPGVGHVSLDQPAAANLVVSLSSSDTTEIKVPASVVILAGATNAAFNFTVVDDAILDGTQGVIVTAKASFYNTAYAFAFVDDNESTTLHIEMPGLLVENGGYVQGRVYTSAPVGDDVDISFDTSPPGLLGFSGFFSFAYIPAGQTSGVFHVQAYDNRRLEGPVKASVVAFVANWTPATNNILILDDEAPTLTVIAPFFVGEGAGLLSNACEVRLTGTVPTNVVVSFSANLGFDYIPIGPVTILPGQTNAHFHLFVGDNNVIDPLRIATLTATAPGFTAGQGGSFLFDNDGPPDPSHPYPPDLSDDIPTKIALSWDRIEGDLLVNGDFETGDLTGWSRSDTGAGGFLVDNGSFDPPSPEGPQPPFAGGFSALSSQFGNGHHELWQDIAIPSGATPVMVSWADRIRNYAGEFKPQSQQFRVEARDPDDNQVLWTLYASQPGDSLLADWVQRTNYLGAYKGKTIRLAFVEDDQLGYLNVRLDSIRVVAGSAAATTFDVYLGTNPVPAAEDFLGSTSNASWPLPLLAAGTDYYWRVDVKRSGITNAGPVWSFRTAGLSSIATLVPFGSNWKYNAHGGDLGTAWRASAYNDAGWSSGLGILGFGGKEDTTIGLAANGYTTFYFRKKIVVANADHISDLNARLIRDDGAVVYINGQRAFSNNMPLRGTISYLTEASTAISGLGETIPVIASLNPGLLVEGTNVIAVEVHQNHPTVGFSPDLLFDLELKASVNVGNEAPTIALTGPGDPVIVQAPGGVKFLATVTDDDPQGLTVSFYANGALIGFDSAPPYGLLWSNIVPGDYNVAATATDSGGLTGASAPVRVIVLPAQGSVFTWIPAGSVWSYNDAGADLGSDWVAPHYRP
ncbi:MAG: M36 family metallopeptidase, partial [Verrucomicrobia bacterium]|nr:M36 family metallopeptidase [Verrucomicrobiota bacterium]